MSEPSQYTLTGGRVPMSEMRVGDQCRSRARTITEADVVNFAGLTGDFHPQHTDAVYAESSQFGGRIAHGMLILSFAFGLLPAEFAVAVRRIRHVVFKRPVFLGDTIAVESTIHALTPMTGDAGLVTGRWRVVNQHDATVARLEVDALWKQQRLSRSDAAT